MYRTIDAAFWTDPKVKTLSPDARLLLLYFITNPHTHVSGLYYVPRTMITLETGLKLPTVNTLCDTLSRAGFCMFDPVREVVWVKNMMRYQGPGDKNAQSAAHHIAKDLHDSPLILDFLEVYPNVKAHIPDRVLDRVSRPCHSPFPIPDSPFPIPENGEQNPENGERTTPPLKKRVGKADLAAEEFRSAYQANIGNPYGWLSGDFVQLAKLRKRLKIETGDTPANWTEAISNYFASPFSEFSLQHFASKFDTFMNSALDRFKTPINHKNGGNHGSALEQTTKSVDSVVRRMADKAERRVQ